MSEETQSVEKTSVDYKARARRAWETRRANQKSGKVETVATTVKRGRGRPSKSTPVVVKKRSAIATPAFGKSFEVTTATYTFDQVRELGAAAVTTDGSSYRLLRYNGTIVPASYFEA